MPQIVTVVDAVVPADQEKTFLKGFSAMAASETPDGFLRSELLRGQDGQWRIQTTWRDREALLAVRSSGTQPPALRLLDSVGAQRSHAVFSVEQRHEK